MTTITLKDNLKLSKTDFNDVVDLYNYMTDNQIVTEVGNLNKGDLSKGSKVLLEKSQKSSNFINI